FLPSLFYFLLSLYCLFPSFFFLLFFFFFFYSSGAHRDLHSFPTRRSSDLDLDRPQSKRFRESTSRMYYWVSSMTCRLSPFPGRIDRKSTRLNSSHQIISYAVFCLKKKKKNKKHIHNKSTTIKSKA